MNADAKIVSESALDRDEQAEKRLLYVAVTRSRQNLFISHSSHKPHELFRKENLPEDSIAFSNNPKVDFDEDDLIDDF